MPFPSSLSSQPTSSSVLLDGNLRFVIGAGDLPTGAVELDDVLENIFDAANAWKAIVLIDEDEVCAMALSGSITLFMSLSGGCVPRKTLRP
jgi:hypothetical protein